MPLLAIICTHPNQSRQKKDVCPSCNALELHKQQPFLTGQMVENIKEHAVLGSKILHFKCDIVKGLLPFPTFEKKDPKIIQSDYGQGIVLPIQKVKQPGPTHFLNKVKVHMFVIRDCTHGHRKGQEEGHADMTHPPSCGCPPERHCYVIDERSCVSKGHSASWCQLWHFIHSQHGPLNGTSQRFAFFCDGAFKSHFTAHFLLWMALCKGLHVFQVFHVSGHGHVEVDALVRSVDAATEGSNIYDVHGLQEVWARAAKEGLEKPPSHRSFPIEFHCCTNREIGNMEPPLDAEFYDLPANVLCHYFIYYVHPEFAGEIGVCRSPDDIVPFDRLPKVSGKNLKIGLRAFRVNLLKNTADHARRKLSRLYEEAQPFNRKVFTEKKQAALNRLTAIGERTLIPHKYHYFYKKDYHAP